MMCRFLGHTQDHKCGTYRMFKLFMKRVVLISDIVWIIKIYCEYVSRLQHTKANTYVLQD